MSRQTVALPKSLIQQRELDTINLLKALREKGFTEGTYQRPDRIFSAGAHVVKINVRDGIVKYNEHTVFRGNRYQESILHIKSLFTNSLSNAE